MLLGLVEIRITTAHRPVRSASSPSHDGTPLPRPSRPARYKMVTMFASCLLSAVSHCPYALHAMLFTSLSPLFLLAWAAHAAPASHSPRACGAKNGYLAYFDLDKCTNKTSSWSPRAVEHTSDGMLSYGPGRQYPHTVCIPHANFTGYVYVDDGKDGSMVQKVGLHLREGMDHKKPGMAFVATHPDDRAGEVGKEKASRVVGE